MKTNSNIQYAFLATVAIILLCCACKDKKETPVEPLVEMPKPAPQDTTPKVVEEEVITVAQEEEDTTSDVVPVPIPPKKADELFDDFMFAFMKNKSMQKQRITFPLPYTIDGQEKEITESQWKYDSMYSRYEMYTMVFDNKRGAEAAKDTKVSEVTVEELDLETQRTKNYNFQRLNGEWMLTSLTDEDMGNSQDSEFYHFYHRFATDPEFRMTHISGPLKFSTFDDDEFKTVEITIEAEEFDDYAPILPQSQMTNFTYGKKSNNSNMRILSLRALAGGMECQMVFKKSGGEWMLTQLDN